MIAGTNDLALRISRDRAAIEKRREQAERDAKQFRDRLTAVYADLRPVSGPSASRSDRSAFARDPTAAESAWAKLARENGLPGAVAAVTNDPASLGPLKGRRILFGLIANRERADALTAARNVPQAGAAAWNSAITRDLDRAAILTLDAIEAGPEMTGRRDAIAELGTTRSGELRREVREIREAEERADIRQTISQEVERGPTLGR